MVRPLSIPPQPLRHDRLRWVSEGVDIRQSLEDSLHHWIANIAQAEAIFEKFVYANEDACEMDFRQHRMWIYDLLHNGERLAVGFCTTTEAGYSEREITAKVAFIDEKLEALKDTLFAWHGPPSADQSIPDALKESFKELQEEKVTDLNFDR